MNVIHAKQRQDVGAHGVVQAGRYSCNKALRGEGLEALVGLEIKRSTLRGHTTCVFPYRQLESFRAF